MEFCGANTLNIILMDINQILKGDVHIPKWLSAGAKNLIKRILDPNPHTRITMAQIKEDGWFKQDYTPVNPDEEDLESDDHASTDDQVFTVHETVWTLDP